jgi:hypothetical protein
VRKVKVRLSVFSWSSTDARYASAYVAKASRISLISVVDGRKNLHFLCFISVQSFIHHTRFCCPSTASFTILAARYFTD